MNNSILCGSQPFWDLDLTWNTDLPTLTRCFRRTTFSLIPNSLLWIIFPFYIANLRRKTLATNAKMSPLSIVKILLAGFLVLVSILDLSFWSLNNTMIGIDILESAELSNEKDTEEANGEKIQCSTTMKLTMCQKVQILH